MDTITVKCLKKRKEGESYEVIRKQLVSEGFEKQKITEILNEVDDLYVQSLIQKSKRGFSAYSVGVLKFVLGIGFISLGFFLIIKGEGSLLFIFFGLIFLFGGWWFFREGRKALMGANLDKKE